MQKLHTLAASLYARRYSATMVCSNRSSRVAASECKAKKVSQAMRLASDLLLVMGSRSSNTVTNNR